MKKDFLYILFIFFIFLNILPGCTLPRMLKLSKQQQVMVQPSILEVSGDNVLFEVKAQVPRKIINKKAVYGLEFVYRYGFNDEDPIGRIAFKPGDFVYEDGKPTITRQFSIPYQSKKNPGILLLQGVASTPQGREKRTNWQEIAKGIVTTSTLIVRNNAVYYVPDTYQRQNKEISTFTLFFDKGEAVLKNYIGTTLFALREFIEMNVKTDSVEIEAGISPEKEERTTSRLAWRRAQTLQKYYVQKLAVSGYVNTSNTVQFKTAVSKPYWDVLLQRIQQSALSEADIQEILGIINGSGSTAEKEEKLKLLDSSEYLETFIYPTMRFAKVKIEYTPVPKKDYEIYLLSKKIAGNTEVPEVLTQQELRYAATLTPLLKEKRQIYETAVATSNHWQAYHNLGIVYLQMAKQEYRPKLKTDLLQTAARNLTYASHRQPTAQNFYHLASAHHLAGNKLEAMQSYDYAIKLGGSTDLLQQVFADKAALEIEVGQLDDALYSLRYAGINYQNYINRGLIYLLKGNYDEAPSFYEEASRLKPNDALANYSLAIIAARKQDENLLTLHLNKAIRADKNFIQKAIEDPEFRAYQKKPAFQAALKPTGL